MLTAPEPPTPKVTTLGWGCLFCLKEFGQLLQLGLRALWPEKKQREALVPALLKPLPFPAVPWNLGMPPRLVLRAGVSG